MELKIRNGDYIADGIGGEQRADGAEALLSARASPAERAEGGFPFCRSWGASCIGSGMRSRRPGCRGEAVHRRGAGGGNGADGGGCGADGARGRGHGPARAADGGRRSAALEMTVRKEREDGEGMDGDL